MNSFDPWNESVNVIPANIEDQFEDNFEPSSVDTTTTDDASENSSLPDSAEYLNKLESRLRKLKTTPSVLQQLAEKRESCMQNLLNGSVCIRDESDLELEAPTADFGPATELLRHIKPEQALSIGEIIHIIKHDQLQGETEEGDEHSDSGASR